GPLRVPDRRRPPAPRVPPVRHGRRRRLRHRSHPVPRAVSERRFRDRPGRGHVLGAVPAMPGPEGPTRAANGPGPAPLTPAGPRAGGGGGGGGSGRPGGRGGYSAGRRAAGGVRAATAPGPAASRFPAASRTPNPASRAGTGTTVTGTAPSEAANAAHAQRPAA